MTTLQEERQKKLHPARPVLYTNNPSRMQEPNAVAFPTPAFYKPPAREEAGVPSQTIVSPNRGPRLAELRRNQGQVGAGQVQADLPLAASQRKYEPLSQQEYAERGRLTGKTAEQYAESHKSAFTLRKRADEESERRIREGAAESQRGLETPESQTAMAELNMQKYSASMGGIAAQYTDTVTDPETGETITTMKPWAAKMSQKWQAQAMSDPEGAAQGFAADIGQAESLMKEYLTPENKAKVIDRYKQLGQNLKGEQRSRYDQQLALLEENTPEAAGFIKKVLGEMDAEQAEREAESARVQEQQGGVSADITAPATLPPTTGLSPAGKSVAEAVGGAYKGTTGFLSDLKRRQIEAAKNRRYIDMW